MWSLLLPDVIKSKERAVPFDFLDAAINGEFPFAPAPKTTPPKLVLLVKPAYKTELVNPFKPPLEDPPTSRVTCGSVAEMPILPSDVMRSFSVGDSDPSAAVENVILPGISPSPGVPSTSKLIFEDEA